jgi:hypothetical protein
LVLRSRVVPETRSAAMILQVASRTSAPPAKLDA